MEDIVAGRPGFHSILLSGRNLEKSRKNQAKNFGKEWKKWLTFTKPFDIIELASSDGAELLPGKRREERNKKLLTNGRRYDRVSELPLRPGSDRRSQQRRTLKTEQYVKPWKFLKNGLGFGPWMRTFRTKTLKTVERFKISQAKFWTRIKQRKRPVF